ncbi:hypothetical protein TNCV_446091 [Trichonephila clavipes]|nr:hypothetical protein TNCV_446091 [Trichonephila clavipes]
MAAPLSICTKEERWTVIHFLFEEGVNPSESICRMQEQYGDSCLSENRVYECIERFKQGRISKMAMKDRTVRLLQPLRFVVVEGIAKEGMTVSSAGITPSAIKNRITSLLSSLMQIGNGATILNGLLLQRLRGKTSYPLYGSVADNLSFSAGY